jgi:hypothetical protein
MHKYGIYLISHNWIFCTISHYSFYQCLPNNYLIIFDITFSCIILYSLASPILVVPTITLNSKRTAPVVDNNKRTEGVLSYSLGNTLARNYLHVLPKSESVYFPGQFFFFHGSIWFHQIWFLNCLQQQSQLRRLFCFTSTAARDWLPWSYS